MYDMDDAGTQGALRGGENLFEQGIDCYVVRFEGAKDPDEYLEKFGVDKMKESILKAMPYIDFRIEIIKRSGDINNSYYKEEALKELASVVEKADSYVVKTDCMKKISAQLGVDYGLLSNYIRSGSAGGQEKTGIIDEYTSLRNKGRELAEKILTSIVLNGFNRDDEAIILGHVFNKMQLMNISYGDFKNEMYSGILKKAEELYKSKENGALKKIELAFIEDERAVKLISELLSREEKKQRKTEEINSIVDDCFSRMREEKLKSSLALLKESIMLAEKENDFEKLKSLLKQKQELQNTIRQRGEDLGKES